MNSCVGTEVEIALLPRRTDGESNRQILKRVLNRIGQSTCSVATPNGDLWLPCGRMYIDGACLEFASVASPDPRQIVLLESLALKEVALACRAENLEIDLFPGAAFPSGSACGYHLNATLHRRIGVSALSGLICAIGAVAGPGAFFDRTGIVTSRRLANGIHAPRQKGNGRLHAFFEYNPVEFARLVALTMYQCGLGLAHCGALPQIKEPREAIDWCRGEFDKRVAMVGGPAVTLARYLSAFCEAHADHPELGQIPPCLELVAAKANAGGLHEDLSLGWPALQAAGESILEEGMTIREACRIPEWLTALQELELDWKRTDGLAADLHRAGYLKSIDPMNAHRRLEDIPISSLHGRERLRAKKIQKLARKRERNRLAINIGWDYLMIGNRVLPMPNVETSSADWEEVTGQLPSHLHSSRRARFEQLYLDGNLASAQEARDDASLLDLAAYSARRGWRSEALRIQEQVPHSQNLAVLYRFIAGLLPDPALPRLLEEVDQTPDAHMYTVAATAWFLSQQDLHAAQTQLRRFQDATSSGQFVSTGSRPNTRFKLQVQTLEAELLRRQGQLERANRCIRETRRLQIRNRCLGDAAWAATVRAKILYDAGRRAEAQRMIRHASSRLLARGNEVEGGRALAIEARMGVCGDAGDRLAAVQTALLGLPQDLEVFLLDPLLAEILAHWPDYTEGNWPHDPPDYFLGIL